MPNLGRLATLEARGRVHFCCSNDLKEKNLFVAIAIENGGRKCFKTFIKVCATQLVSFYLSLIVQNVKILKIKVRSAVSCCEKVNKVEKILSRPNELRASSSYR